MKRPTRSELADMHLTVGELAARLYPKERGYSVDTSIPWEWMQNMQARGFQYCSDVVWVYDEDHSLFGAPGPLTQEAAEQLEDMSEVTV